MALLADKRAYETKMSSGSLDEAAAALVNQKLTPETLSKHTSIINGDLHAICSNHDNSQVKYQANINIENSTYEHNS